MNNVLLDSRQSMMQTPDTKFQKAKPALRLYQSRLSTFFCCVMLACTIVSSSSLSFAQTCSGACGDANETNTVNFTDVVYTLNWLRLDGAPAPYDDILCASTDGCDLVTIRDCVWTKRYIFNGGNQPDCSVGPKYVPTVNPNLVIEYNEAFPPNQTDLAITLYLTSTLVQNLEGYSIPFTVEVGGEVATVVSINLPPSGVLAAYGQANPAGGPPGSVRLIGMANNLSGIPPGTYELATIRLSVPTLAFWRLIELKWADLPPVMDGMIERSASPVNYPMVVDEALNGWEPVFEGFICGDVDGSGFVNISDAVYLVAFVFSGGPSPEPLFSADVNCDKIVSISDVVKIVNYVFDGGPAPCSLCI